MDALKYDDEKIDLSMVPKSLMYAVAEVLMFGARKYERHNWRKGMVWSRLIAATLRHIHAFNEGEDLDPESKLNHLHHAACDIAFLIEYYKEALGQDDRFKPGV
jgi:hypothetical protein